MELFSMGMFCEDEIHMPKKSHYGVIGGAGTYAALGAGVAVPLSERSKIGFICDEGYDFKSEVHDRIASWGLGTIFRVDKSRETTKAWNKFVNNEERLFKYLSPKRQIFVEDMPESALNARMIHLICSPERCENFMLALQRINTPNQHYIWEPVPTECVPAQYENLKRVVITHKIDILSPNALEAAALVGLPEPTTKREVEDLVSHHFEFAPIIVVRCGAMGSYLRTGSIRAWYPPYFHNNPDRVVDPSGAGNAFTGALGLAISRNLEWDVAMAFANVGASFMIEQLGMPTYDREHDLWNGESGPARISQYLTDLRSN